MPPPSKPGSHRPYATAQTASWESWTRAESTALPSAGTAGRSRARHGNFAEAWELQGPEALGSEDPHWSHLTPHTGHSQQIPTVLTPKADYQTTSLDAQQDDEAAAACSRTSMALESVRVCGSVDSGTLNTGLRTYTNHFQGLWPSPVGDTDDEAVHVARWTDARAPPGPACLATSAKQENSSHLPCSPLRMVVCGSCTGRVWPRKDRCTCCRRRCTACWMRECSSSQEGSGDFHDGRAAGCGQAPTPPNQPLHPISNQPQSTSRHPQNHLQTLWSLHHAKPGNPFNADRARCARSSFVRRPGPVLVGLQGAGRLGVSSNLRSGPRPRHDLRLALLRPTPAPNGDFRP